MQCRNKATLAVKLLRRILGTLLVVGIAAPTGAIACGLRWASTGVNSNTLPDCFAYAQMALKANGFQNIQKTASEVTGAQGGAFAAVTCFGTPKHTAMIMVFGNSDAANLSKVNAIRTKIAGYAPL